MIPVKFLTFNDSAPSQGYWDQTLLFKFFAQKEFQIVEDLDFQKQDVAIVIIPGRQNVEYIKEINQYINNLQGVVLIIGGDEEGNFPIDQIIHTNIKVWLMTPHVEKAYPTVDRFIGEGYTPHCEYLPSHFPIKERNWFFAGQVTHQRRADCVFNLRNMSNGKLIETAGFTQGIDPKAYIHEMSVSRVIPCPGGPETPDTFRFYEALESGCIPIADEYSAKDQTTGYWQMLFGENFPFPTIKSWEELPELLLYFNDTFIKKQIEIMAWWINYKRDLFITLINDYKAIGGSVGEQSITVIIPTSPIPSNPSTEIIDETISTIRSHLPDVEIIITFDGVREEQLEKTLPYLEFQRECLWKANRGEYGRVRTIVFNEHLHQTGMIREALQKVTTPHIRYVEHDTPLTPDCDIDWEYCNYLLSSNTLDLIRFHFESSIPKEHEYLMLKQYIKNNVYLYDFLPTIQWSQRPHLARKDFYNRILHDHFSINAKAFIEDQMYKVVIEAYKKEHKQGWNKFKLAIYHPMDGNIKRSYNLDGRKQDPKYSMTF